MSPDVRPALVGLAAVLTGCGPTLFENPKPPPSPSPTPSHTTIDALVCGAIDPDAHDGLCTRDDLPVPPGFAVTWTCEGVPFATAPTQQGGRTAETVIPPSCREVAAIGLTYKRPTIELDGVPVDTCAQVTMESHPPKYTTHIELFPCDKSPNSSVFKPKPPIVRRIGRQNWKRSG